MLWYIRTMTLPSSLGRVVKSMASLGSCGTISSVSGAGSRARSSSCCITVMSSSSNETTSPEQPAVVIMSISTTVQSAIFFICNSLLSHTRRISGKAKDEAAHLFAVENLQIPFRLFQDFAHQQQGVRQTFASLCRFFHVYIMQKILERHLFDDPGAPPEQLALQFRII